MDSFDGARLIYLIGALVLVASGLGARRLGFGQSVRLALIWIGIFILAFMIVDNRQTIGRALGIVPADQPLQDAPVRADIT